MYKIDLLALLLWFLDDKNARDSYFLVFQLVWKQSAYVRILCTN